MTELDGRAERVCDLYGRRMCVEELFRDGKGRRNGPPLRDARFRRADRFDRFLRAAAPAYVLLVGLGLKAKWDHDPSAWCANRRAKGCSTFAIGKVLLDRTNDLPDDLL